MLDGSELLLFGFSFRRGGRKCAHIADEVQVDIVRQAIQEPVDVSSCMVQHLQGSLRIFS